MTINDIELETAHRKVCRAYCVLDLLTRNGQEQALFNAYADLEAAARECQQRLNRMRFEKGKP
jgi:hypothetical protein